MKITTPTSLRRGVDDRRDRRGIQKLKRNRSRRSLKKNGYLKVEEEKTYTKQI
jgi:hypothetical protein